MVEFAIAFWLLFTVLAGTFQFGYTFYVYNLLQTQVRSGARYASAKTFACNGSGAITTFKTAVKQMVVYGDPSAGSSIPLVPGLTTAMVDVQIKDSGGTDADSSHVPATVKINVGGGNATTYTVNAIFTSYFFSGKPVLTFPYVGRYAPSEP